MIYLFIFIYLSFLRRNKDSPTDPHFIVYTIDVRRFVELDHQFVNRLDGLPLAELLGERSRTLTEVVTDAEDRVSRVRVPADLLVSVFEQLVHQVAYALSVALHRGKVNCTHARTHARTRQCLSAL